MEELKLRRLHRGYILTDFENNEIGIKDSEQAINEIKNLLGMQPHIQDTNTSKYTTQESVEQEVIQENDKQKRFDSFELQTKILEKAREQITQNGKVSATKIARELGANISTVNNYLKKKLNTKIDELVEEWQKEQAKKQEEQDKEHGKEEPAPVDATISEKKLGIKLIDIENIR